VLVDQKRQNEESEGFSWQTTGAPGVHTILRNKVAFPKLLLFITHCLFPESQHFQVLFNRSVKLVGHLPQFVFKAMISAVIVFGHKLTSSIPRPLAAGSFIFYHEWMLK